MSVLDAEPADAWLSALGEQAPEVASLVNQCFREGVGPRVLEILLALFASRAIVTPQDTSADLLQVGVRQGEANVIAFILTMQRAAESGYYERGRDGS